MITLTLPYPPTVNHYWTLGNGRIYVAPRGRQYRRHVGSILCGVPRQSGRLAVEIVTHAPDARRRDLDNVLKCLLDSLTLAGAWDDDSQIDDLRIVRGGLAPKDFGMVTVRISQLQTLEELPQDSGQAAAEQVERCEND